MSNMNLNSLNDQTLVENTTGQITATALHGLIAAIIAAITAITLTQGVGVPHAATIANLKAMSLSAFQSGSVVSLDGYYKPGDMPETAYVLNTSACSTNGGSGDGGSCYPASVATSSWQLTAQFQLDPRVFGILPGGTDLYGTNAAQFNALLTYARTVSDVNAPITVDGGGRNYAVGDMVKIAGVYNSSGQCSSYFSGLRFQNFALQPTPAFVGSSTKGVLGIVDCSASITVENIFIDLQSMPVYGIYDTQPGLIRLLAIRIRHWGGGGANGASAGLASDGGCIHFSDNLAGGTATVDLYDIVCQQFIGADASYGDLTKRAGTNLWWDGHSGGSAGTSVQLQGGLSTMRMEANSGGIKLFSSYFLLGCANSGCTDPAHLGQPQQDPVYIDMADGATDLELYGSTLSGCKINYLADASNPPVLTIGAGMRYIYGSGGAVFSPNFGNQYGNFINIITSGANTSYKKVQVGEATNYPTASNTPFILALGVTGAGSWQRPACGNSGGMTLNTTVLTKIATQNSILALGSGCTSMAGSTLGDFYGIGADITGNDSADKYCGESVYFNASATITFTLPYDTPGDCRIAMVQGSTSSYPVTLAPATGATLNGATGTKTLTRFQAGVLEDFRNVNGTAAQWFTYGGL